MTIGVGIDLGTTTSEIAYFDAEEDPDRATVVSIDNATIVPSVVWFDDATSRIVVGQAARERQISYPDRIISSVKRQIGKTDLELKDAVTGDVRLPLLHANRTYGPTEISAEILKYLKVKAQPRTPGQRSISDVVVTVPADYSVLQKKATVDAVHAAGLNLLMLLSEPVAALLAYNDIDHTQDQKIFVFDLGGGTLDCTIIEIVGKENFVRAKSGKMDIAGDCIDQLLFDHLIRKIENQSNVNLDPRHTRSARQAIMDEARKLKERLSEHEVDSGTLEVVLLKDADGKRFDVKLTLHRDEFEGLIAPIITMNEHHVLRALNRSRYQSRDIDKVVLVGGSTRIPMVQQMLERHFRPEQIFSNVAPDLVVAQGAAKASYYCQMGEPLVIDTVTHTLGMRELSSFRFEPLIWQGQGLSRAKVEKSITLLSERRAIGVDLYEIDPNGSETEIQTIHDTSADGQKLCLYAGTWEVISPHILPANSEITLLIQHDVYTSLPFVEARHASGALDVRHSLQSVGITAGVEMVQRDEIDVVFVVDTTGSIRHSGHWNDIKLGLKESAETLHERGWDTRLGLTTFGRSYPKGRDDNGSQYDDRIASTDMTSDLREFISLDIPLLERRHTEGGGDSESCLDALWQASHIGLREGGAKRSVLILITDSGRPAKPNRDNQTLETLIKELKQRKVSVCCVSPLHTAYNRLCAETYGEWLEIDIGSVRQHLKTIVAKLTGNRARVRTP